jgi:hypothetical protein
MPVWETVSAGQSELEPLLRPVRNYMTALIAKTAVNPRWDFALAMLTERVASGGGRLAPAAGRPAGKLRAHGTGGGESHCLLGTQARALGDFRGLRNRVT